MTEHEELLQEAEELLRSLGMPPGSRVRTDAAEERAAPAEESAEGGTEGGAAEDLLSAVTLQAEAEQMLTALSREHAAAERFSDPLTTPLRGAVPSLPASRHFALQGEFGPQAALSAAFGGEAASHGIQPSRPDSVPTAEHRLAAADAEAVDRSFERDARRYDGGFRMR